MRFRGVSFRETASGYEFGMWAEGRWNWKCLADLCRGYIDMSSVVSGAAAWSSATCARMSASSEAGTLHFSVLANPPFLNANVRQASDTQTYAPRPARFPVGSSSTPAESGKRTTRTSVHLPSFERQAAQVRVGCFRRVVTS
jgi:hypothetical protein